ncbi:hypothetical protein ACWEWU_14430 [Staphylococcus xylosus]
MVNSSILIKDINFESSNVSFGLCYKNTYIEDDFKTVIFDVTITYEDKIIKDEFVIFSHEINKLNNLTNELNEIDYYFYEPNVSFTVFESIAEDIVFYINLDSGLKYSNHPSDSGLSIRLEIEKIAFNKFINQIKSYLV